jgi:polysaccharide biosynthesis protein PslH
MKILQLSTKVPYPPKDGGGAGVFIFSKSLAQLGHQVTILAVNPPKHFVPKSLIEKLPLQITIIPVAFDTRLHWIKALKNIFFDVIPYQVVRFIHKSFECELVKVIYEFQPDIIQLEGLYLCPYISLIKRHSSARIILRAHNIEHILWRDIALNERHPLKRAYLKIQAGRMEKYEVAQLARMDAITTVTENDLAILRHLKIDTRSKLIPFGLESYNGMSSRLFNKTAIAFIGALDWIPNQEAIRWFTDKVWPQIQLRFPGLEFHIAGRSAPAKLISVLQSKKGILFHGEVPESKAFLDQFSIMIVPLFSGSGIRVKIIEAMQQGLIVIASSKAAEGIPAISGRHLFIANTPEEFVATLEYVLTNNAITEQISADAMRLVREKFNILAIASGLTGFYNEVING